MKLNLEERLTGANVPKPLVRHLVDTWRASGAPPCPQDCVVGPPSFVGIGAMKAGTSWWFHLILQHPDVFSPRGRGWKETHFFDYAVALDLDDQAIRAYHELFPRPAGKVAGEWTPRYLSDFWVPRALSRAAPDTKLLVVVRDPVARFISGVTHQLKKTDINRGLVPIIDIWPRQFARGLYADDLERFLKHFERSQLLVLQFEQCVTSPLEQLERTYRFLGIDPDFRPRLRDIEQPVNKTAPATKFESPDHLLESVTEAYRPSVDRLAEEFPEIDTSLWRAIH